MNDSTAPLSKLSFFALIAAALVVARVPFLHIPFDWVETYFHELSHGLMAFATGGRIDHIELRLDGSGACFTVGGSRFLVSFAGYAGAVVWGALLYVAVGTASRRAAQILTGLLGLMVVLSGLLWVRDVVSGLILAVILLLVITAHQAGRFRLTGLFMRFIAVYVMLSAARAPLQLIDGRALGDGHTLASLTWLPEVVWVLLWEAIALGGLWLIFRTHGGAKPALKQP